MRYFIDTEFSERGYARVDLISIAVVAADDREFYAVAEDGWSVALVNDWVRQNVLPHLGDAPRLTRIAIRDEIRSLVGRDPKPEFWGYFADYDWVLLCQLFGAMMDLPRGWPMYCNDVRQMAGSVALPVQQATPHNALEDARHIRTMWKFCDALGL